MVREFLLMAGEREREREREFGQRGPADGWREREREFGQRGPADGWREREFGQTGPADGCAVNGAVCLTGVAQGIVTGIRGLCNGLGPAMFGCVFYMFHVNLSEDNKNPDPVKPDNTSIPLFQTSLKVGATVLCVLRQSRAWEERRHNQGSLWAGATVLCVLRQGRA